MEQKGEGEGRAVEAERSLAVAEVTARTPEIAAVIVTDEKEQPTDIQLSATKHEVTPTSMEQEATPTNIEQEATPTRMEQEATPTRMEQEATPTIKEPEPTPKLKAAPCDVVAESVVSQALQESIQGRLGTRLF